MEGGCIRRIVFAATSLYLLSIQEPLQALKGHSVGATTWQNRVKCAPTKHLRYLSDEPNAHQLSTALLGRGGVVSAAFNRCLSVTRVALVCPPVSSTPRFHGLESKSEVDFPDMRYI